MNDEQYRQYGRDELADFGKKLSEQTNELPQEDPLRELASAFCELGEANSALYDVGPGLVSRLFTTYPEWAPTLPRHALWFLGGDCLHFMADEEIALFQELEEQRLAAAAEGKLFNIQEARANLLNLQ
ncbi:MAG: PA2817 family protein [Halioglobus sp.]